MKKRYLRSCLLFILPLTAFVCHVSLPTAAAVEIHPNAGTTSAAFLKLGAGSRAVSLGSAFAGLADDVSAIYWNPAGLAQLQRQEFQVYHNESFESIRNDFVAYAVPMNKGIMAAAITGLYTPKDIERRSGLNEADPYEPLSPIEGLFQAYDVAAHVGYGRWLRKDLAAGMGVKLIQQTIDNRSAYGVAVDLGILYRSSRLPLSTGLVIQNAGTPVKFTAKSYPLPLNFKLGTAWRWNRFLVSTIDLNKPIDNFLFVSAGTEYTPINLLSLRAGYRYRLNGLELGDLSGLSAGLGFNFRLQNTDLRFDYAFVPFGILGNSHRLSVGMLFGVGGRNITVDASAAPSKAMKDYGIRTAAPPLPQNLSAPVRASDPGGYTFYPAQLTGKRRMASGRTAVYRIHGSIQGSDLQSFDGTIRIMSIQGLQLEVGEKPGSGKVYRHYTFRRNMPDRIPNALCTIRVPSSLGSFVIRTDDGNAVPVRKISADDRHSIYQFTLESLKPFRIEK